MSDILERSSSSKAAKSVFFEEVNDIDIFVEDTAQGYEKIHRVIFQRLLGDRYKITKVFPLGERNSVIDECDSNQGAHRRPTLYVVDGDLFLLSGEINPLVGRVDGLFVLPFYCIENLFIDKNAIVTLLDELDLSSTSEEIEAGLEFETWLNATAPLLMDLFLEYSAVFRCAPHIQTVAYELKNIISSGDGMVDADKIRARISEIKNALYQCCEERLYKSSRAEIGAKLNGNFSDFLNYVSGKDYIFPLILKRMKTVVSFKLPNANIKLKLASLCDLSRMSNVQDFIVHDEDLNSEV